MTSSHGTRKPRATARKEPASGSRYGDAVVLKLAKPTSERSTANARPQVDLDAYYASRPKPRELFYWPVFDDPFFGHRPIAWFDTYGEAVSFVNESVGKREFYIGEPRYRLTEVSGDPLKGLVA